jgi:hypothetical protein
MPSTAILEAVHFIHKAGYSHVIIQQARMFTGVFNFVHRSIDFHSDSTQLALIERSQGPRCCSNDEVYICDSQWNNS